MAELIVFSCILTKTIVYGHWDNEMDAFLGGTKFYTVCHSEWIIDFIDILILKQLLIEYRLLSKSIGTA